MNQHLNWTPSLFCRNSTGGVIYYFSYKSAMHQGSTVAFSGCSVDNVVSYCIFKNVDRLDVTFYTGAHQLDNWEVSLIPSLNKYCVRVSFCASNSYYNILYMFTHELLTKEIGNMGESPKLNHLHNLTNRCNFIWTLVLQNVETRQIWPLVRNLNEVGFGRSQKLISFCIF